MHFPEFINPFFLFPAGAAFSSDVSAFLPKQRRKVFHLGGSNGAPVFHVLKFIAA